MINKLLTSLSKDKITGILRLLHPYAAVKRTIVFLCVSVIALVSVVRNPLQYVEPEATQTGANLAAAEIVAVEPVGISDVNATIVPDTDPEMNAVSSYTDEAIYYYMQSSQAADTIMPELHNANDEQEKNEEVNAGQYIPLPDESDSLWVIAVSMEDFVYLSEIPLSEELQRHTYWSCIENKLDYYLVLALMWRESRFKLDAVGVNDNGTTDSGVMQINDVNKQWLEKELGVTDLLDPWQNITAGTTMLGRYTEKYGTQSALLAYQYGETGMNKKLAQGVTTNGQIQQLYVKREDFVEMLKA